MDSKLEEKERDYASYHDFGKQEEEEDGRQEKLSSSFLLSPHITIENPASEIYTIEFSPSGNQIACGCGDGAVRVFNTVTGALSYTLRLGHSDAPVTSIRYRPQTFETRTKNVLVATNSDGEVFHFHVVSQKTLHSIKEEDNEIFSLDFTAEGDKFATGGKDRIIRIYDEATKSEISRLTPNAMSSLDGGDLPGHSNRIFSLKFAPFDSNVLLSGGWDNVIYYWDLRMERPVKSIFGHHISGESIDISRNREILVGSYQLNSNLEVYDFQTGEKLEDIHWDAQHSDHHHHHYDGDSATTASTLSPPSSPHHPMSRASASGSKIYSCKFSRTSNRLIAAGGIGTNECRLFSHSLHKPLHFGYKDGKEEEEEGGKEEENEGGHTALPVSQTSPLSTISNLQMSVFSLDFSHDDSQFAIGGNHTVQIFNISH